MYRVKDKLVYKRTKKNLEHLTFLIVKSYPGVKNESGSATQISIDTLQRFVISANNDQLCSKRLPTVAEIVFHHIFFLIKLYFYLFILV